MLILEGKRDIELFLNWKECSGQNIDGHITWVTNFVLLFTFIKGVIWSEWSSLYLETNFSSFFYFFKHTCILRKGGQRRWDVLFQVVQLLLYESKLPEALSTGLHDDPWGADVKFTMGLEIEADWVCSHNLKEKGRVRFNFIFSCGFQVEVLKHLFTFPNLWYAPPLRWLRLNENIQVSMAKWAKSRKWKLKMSAHNGENFNKNLVWSFLCFQLYSASSPFLFLWGRVNSDALLQTLTGQSTGCFHSRLSSFLFVDQVSCNPDGLQTLYVSDDEPWTSDPPGFIWG